MTKIEIILTALQERPRHADELMELTKAKNRNVLHSLIYQNKELIKTKHIKLYTLRTEPVKKISDYLDQIVEWRVNKIRWKVIQKRLDERGICRHANSIRNAVNKHVKEKNLPC